MKRRVKVEIGVEERSITERERGRGGLGYSVLKYFGRYLLSCDSYLCCSEISTKTIKFKFVSNFSFTYHVSHSYDWMFTGN